MGSSPRRVGIFIFDGAIGGEGDGVLPEPERAPHSVAETVYPLGMHLLPFGCGEKIP
jgi:hypothetical protein